MTKTRVHAPEPAHTAAATRKAEAKPAPKRRILSRPSAEVPAFTFALQQEPDSPLPYRNHLEGSFGVNLGGVHVKRGPAVDRALDGVGAEAAYSEGFIFLGTGPVSLVTVAHEVAHALQRDRGTRQATNTAAAEFEAEAVAQRIAARRATPTWAPIPIFSALPFGAVAMREAVPAPGQSNESERRQQFRRAVNQPRSEAAAQPGLAGVAETMATGADAAEAAPLLQPPPEPQPGVTPEEVAAREQQLAQAQQALTGADSAAGAVDAFSSAPPTLKAQFAGRVGDQVNQSLQTETQALQNETPEIRAELHHPDQPPPGPLQVGSPPTAGDVTLEPSAPSHAPAPELAPLPPVAPFAGNAGIVERSTRLDPAAQNNAEQVGEALHEVQTTDPSISTSAGPPPPMPLEGDADPHRLQTQVVGAQGEMQTNLAAAQQQVMDGPGPERVQPVSIDESHRVEELAPPTVQPTQAPEGAQQYLQSNMPPEVQTAFDAQVGPQMQASMAEAQTAVQDATTARDQQHDAAVQDAQAQNERAVQDADSQQRREVTGARERIQTERQSTLDRQNEEVHRVESEADERRQRDRGDIDTRVATDQERIDTEYSRAENDAQQEVRSGERRAEEERRRAEREAEEQSWWDRAVNFVRSAFQALVSAINAVFNAVRSAINAILNAVRDIALGIINAVTSFIREAIAVFGQFLVGLVQGLLGDIFPGLAAALTEFIESAVAVVTAAIDAVAAGLRSIVNTIVEGLRGAINAALSAFQAAVNAGLAILQAALTGDWAALARQLFEAICRAAGIDPQAVYRIVGQAMEALQIIIDDPGQFLRNLVDAFLGGFRKFGDNFLTHLQQAIISWLTGAIGGAGIQIPERFDLMGVLSLIQQILGLTWENLRPRIVRLIGERGVQVLEFVASYVQTLITGGWAGLWQRIQDDLSTLKDMVLQQIRDFLVQRIIVAAITQLATMFNPVGAIVQLAIKIYNFCQFLINQIQRIWAVAQRVIESISQIAHGNLEPAKTGVENVLAGLLPLAIDLLARLIGLGNVSGRVREIIQGVQQTIWRAIDRLIERVVGLFRGGGGAGAAPAAPAAPDNAIGERVPVPIPGGETHHVYVQVQGQAASLMVQSTTRPVLDQLTHWETLMNQVEASRHAEVRGMMNDTRRLVTAGDREADALALARWRAREATPQATSRAAEMRTMASTLSENEHAIASLLVRLFPIFEEDTRAIALRFDRANSIDTLRGEFRVAAWMSAFGITNEQNAYRELRWGNENRRAERGSSRGSWRLTLSENDLVALAVRVVAAEGRRAPELVGPSKPSFTSDDLVAFCVRVERLPNDRATYSAAVMGRITSLMVQRGDASRHPTQSTAFTFSPTPARRRIPGSWDTDRYRRHFYLNGSQYATQRENLINDSMRDITPAASKLSSSDAATRQEGTVFFQRLKTRNVIDQSDLDTATPAQLATPSEWDADHQRPLALHWSQGGNNTHQPARKAIAELPNLRLMWGPKNSREGGRGGSFVTYNWVGPDFTSPVTPRGGQMVDTGVFFENWDSARSVWV